MEVRAKNPFCLDVSRKLNSNLERIRNNAVFTVSQNYLCSTLNGVCVCVCGGCLTLVQSFRMAVVRQLTVIGGEKPQECR